MNTDQRHHGDSPARQLPLAPAVVPTALGSLAGRWIGIRLLCCLLLWCGPVHAEEPGLEEPEVTSALYQPLSDTAHWHIRPEGFLYSTYWASAAEPRMAFHLVNERDGDLLADSHIGGRLGLVRWGPRHSRQGFQLDILGGAKLRQNVDLNLDVIGTDYRYDILGTFANGPHELKLGTYHVSSHAGDEFLISNPGFNRLNFSRDVLVLGYAHRPSPKLRLYAEVGWGYRVDVSKPWEFQGGFDYGPAEATGMQGAPFAAANVHLREELDFGGNVAVQAGWAWRSQRANDGLLRTGLYYYDGGSPQFSFYTNHERQIGWGLWYDF